MSHDELELSIRDHILLMTLVVRPITSDCLFEVSDTVKVYLDSTNRFLVFVSSWPRCQHGGTDSAVITHYRRQSKAVTAVSTV